MIVRYLTQARGTEMAKRWYVVHAYSRFRVARVKRSLLEERIERGRYGRHKFGEILVPTEEVVEMREGQQRRSERKFFPGLRAGADGDDEDTWHLVKDVPKVLGFIGGSSDRPPRSRIKEADAILQRVQEGVDKPRRRCCSSRARSCG
jgi:transcriptional antiterminator NusG